MVVRQKEALHTLLRILDFTTPHSDLPATATSDQVGWTSFESIHATIEIQGCGCVRLRMERNQCLGVFQSVCRHPLPNSAGACHTDVKVFLRGGKSLEAHLSCIVEVGRSVDRITGVIEVSFASCRFWRKSLRSVLVAAITTIRTHCGSVLSPKHLDLSSDYGYTTEASNYRRHSEPLRSSGVRHLVECGRFEQTSSLNGRHYAVKAANAW